MLQLAVSAADEASILILYLIIEITDDVGSCFHEDPSCFRRIVPCFPLYYFKPERTAINGVFTGADSGSIHNLNRDKWILT